MERRPEIAEKYVLPRWSLKKVRELERYDVARLLHTVGQKYPYAANRLLELLSKMFELAKLWGYIDQVAVNPARGIPRFKEQERDRFFHQKQSFDLLTVRATFART